MKKLLCIFILLLSVTTFALQKSGIKEYDDLDLTKGEIVLYMDKEGTVIDDPSAAQYYRKSFGKKGSLYLFVDFYSYNDSPVAIFKSSDSKGIEKMDGKYVSYYPNGSLNNIGDVKDKEFNGKKINLSQSSSGIQSLIPLLLVLDNELSQSVPNIANTIVVEEPELNLFPIKQKKIIEFIVEKVNFSNSSMIITTHSPYILSVLDTLILAKNTYNEHLDLKVEINSIITESKWINYDDISVYEVRNDGTVHSIKNEEFKSIDANAIDSVSDIISNEFDKLTDLRYEQ